MRHLVLPCRWLLACCCLLAGLAAHAQAPAWQTAIAVQNPGLGFNSGINATATDAAGNVYVAGSLSGTAILGSTTLVSTGPYSMFVAKWSASSGSFVWAMQGGGAGGTVARALVVSGQSVYVAGGFSGAAATFGSYSLTNASSSYSDVFVAKLIDSGASASFVWVQQAGGTNDEEALALGIDENNLYVAGFFGSSAAAFGSTTLATAGGYDGFIAKLVDAGSTSTFGWVRSIGGVSAEQATALVVGGGAVCLTGFFYGTASLGTATLSSAGDADTFVAKLTDLGSTARLDWARALGGPGTDTSSGLALSGATLYVAGTFRNTISIGTTTLTSAGEADAYLAKLTDTDTSSTVGWARQVAGPQGETGVKVATRGGGVYLLGCFGIGPNGTASTAAIGSTTLASLGTSDVFLAKFTDTGSSGSLVWVQQAGSAEYDYVGGLAFDGAKVYVGGTFNGSPMLLGSLSLTKTNGAPSAFLAALSDPVLPARSAALLADLGVWPNPAHATATVRLPAGAGPATLTLLDALGRAVHTQTAAPGTDCPLDLAGLAAGLYALHVQMGEALAVRQLVVQ